jgi:hypothetical protein
MEYENAYDAILAMDDLDEEERAHFLKLRDERIVEDKLENIRCANESREQRLKELADLSLLEPMDEEFHAKYTPCEIPSETQLAPQWGSKLSHTKDFLFLAALLERSHEADYILQCGPRGKTEEWIYLPESARNPIPEGYTVKQRLSSNHVRRLFKECFFGFRKALSKPGRSHWCYSIGGIEIRHAGSRGDQPFWDFAANLHHPFHKGRDPLLEGLYARRFFDFPDTQATKEAPFLCPIDGPVRAVRASLNSPNWTWRKECGRSWRMALCPKCLGELAETGYAMN